jgi:hypothetical protein
METLSPCPSACFTSKTTQQILIELVVDFTLKADGKFHFGPYLSNKPLLNMRVKSNFLHFIKKGPHKIQKSLSSPTVIGELHDS